MGSKQNLAVLIGVFILMSGCVLETEEQNSQIAEQQQTVEQNNQSEAVEQEDELERQKILAQEECDTMDLLEMTKCYSQIAATHQDVEICEKIAINDSQKRQLSIDYCMAKVAFAKQDWEICSQIESSTIKDACMMDIAMDTEDEQVCSHIVDLQNKYSGCYIELATHSNSTEICDRIDNRDYKNYCYALVEKDEEYCKKIEISNLADTCHLELSWSEKDYRICSGIVENMTHDVCLATVATYKQNRSICEFVRLAVNEQNCINEVQNPAFPLNG